ncbi:LAMI_0A01970g1_1 [Lachancea mirantina]|uniref:LAMI_0A01970g1_1 n=1 Tax=Lachancea mirantina TaxID=1230905 RepID=A0A1G4IMA2_9SACH|nr:LAMI_0A01970g1_1 [Lachancea mirantina]
MATTEASHTHPARDAYRQTQGHIYDLQETLLKSARSQEAEKSPETAPVATAAAAPTVNSEQLLAHTDENFGSQHPVLGELQYSAGPARPQTPADKLFPYDYLRHAMPAPLIPACDDSAINGIWRIFIPHEELRDALSATPANRRICNNEIWGSDIYTDDSDVILVLQHCGAFATAKNSAAKRTPANRTNCNAVSGLTGPLQNAECDLVVDILMLPPLQNYASSNRNDVESRAWSTTHDGLSYGIYALEFRPRSSPDATST